MKKFMILLAILTFTTALMAQGVPPQVNAPAPDYSLHFSMTGGAALTILNDTKGADFADNVGVAADFYIPVSKRFSFKVGGYGNWNTIKNVAGYAGYDQKLSTTTINADLRFNFLPVSKYQVYILGGVEGYRTAYDNSDYHFTKMDYSLGVGTNLFFNQGKFVVNLEGRYYPDNESFGFLAKADCFIWKDKVAITPMVKYSNVSIKYLATGANVNWKMDSYAIGCGITFKF